MTFLLKRTSKHAVKFWTWKWEQHQQLQSIHHHWKRIFQRNAKVSFSHKMKTKCPLSREARKQMTMVFTRMEVSLLLQILKTKTLRHEDMKYPTSPHQLEKPEDGLDGFCPCFIKDTISPWRANRICSTSLGETSLLDLNKECKAE